MGFLCQNVSLFIELTLSYNTPHFLLILVILFKQRLEINNGCPDTKKMTKMQTSLGDSGRFSKTYQDMDL